MKQCENCHRQIGDLETPHIYESHIVCRECEVKLSLAKRMPSATHEAVVRVVFYGLFCAVVVFLVVKIALLHSL